MSSEYIGECPECGQHALRCDDCICWRVSPEEDAAYASSLAHTLAGMSELKYLVATYSAHCHDCGWRYEICEILDTLQEEQKPEDPALRCNHCHTRWGEGAEKDVSGEGLTVCSRCWYSQ